jgi:uncharacterized protein (TIGR01777 family)
MHILITGGTGFIGKALCPQLLRDGHQLTMLSRQSLPDTRGCRYIASLKDIPAAECIDAVINLAGASLADRRWTSAYKGEILASRLETTDALLHLLKRLKQKPSVLLSASAIGYYGHHGDEELDESGTVTAGFSQDLCQQWEHLALTSAELGVRVCLLRLGVVLDSGGGAFSQMAQSFNFGVASWLGSGKQWLSWVHRADVISAMLFLLQREDLEGPFNITAPHPVTNRGFCDDLKRHKRTLISAPVPAAVLRLLLGEMADELLLNGQRVLPVGLQQAGFNFAFPDLDTALADIV